MKLILVVLAAFLVLGAQAYPFEDNSEESVMLMQEIEELLAESEFEGPEYAVDESTVAGALQCGLCKQAVTQVLDKVPKEATKARIINALYKSCSVIPTKGLKEKCREGVDSKGEAIVDKIINNLSSEVVCKLITMC